MSLLFRAFGAVQDGVTRVIFGAEQRTAKMAFYECVDKNMKGEEVKVY
mgnify:CR=1 FL=1